MDLVFSPHTWIAFACLQHGAVSLTAEARQLEVRRLAMRRGLLLIGEIGRALASRGPEWRDDEGASDMYRRCRKHCDSRAKRFVWSSRMGWVWATKKRV